MIAQAVYLLCALTSVLCAVLLLLGYRRNRLAFLFWSSLCFVFLAINNVLLFVDVVVVPELDLSIARTVPAVLGISLLVWGFVREAE